VLAAQCCGVTFIPDSACAAAQRAQHLSGNEHLSGRDAGRRTTALAAILQTFIH
jgi:hypothetical protein